MNAINAYNRLNANVAGLKKASEKLSSGYRINRAGDDAAGLAISEKMRSQIKGLNQATRNAQDGINMIQTFEGAAQETHSILQRMKELAVESANGTYDNPTDRAAIELEFGQLNDELNQIADTDFNGTIVLNGGEMSDGLIAVDNADGSKTFDYKNLNSQKDEKVATLQKQIDDLKATVPSDISKKQDADGNKIMANDTDLNDDTYTDAVAKGLWGDLGLPTDGSVASIDLQFTATKAADGSVSYKATSAVAYDKDDKALDIKFTDAQLAKIVATSKAANGTGAATGHGGFSFKGSATGDIANVTFDATNVATGDMINFHINGPAASPKAPTNALFADKYGDGDNLTSVGIDGTAKATTTVSTAPTATLNTTNVTDAKMSDAYNKIFQALNGAEIEIEVGASSTATTNATTIKIGGNAITTGQANKIGTDADGNDVNAWVVINAGKATISTVNGTAKGDDLIEIDLGKYVNTDNAKTATATATLVLNKFSYPDASKAPDVNVKDADLGKFSVDDQVAALQKQIDNIKNGDDTIATKSNSYENAKSIMTYTDNITLQTGARTKDAVNFTFKYNTDKSADMGTLEANLNLSAREKGLNTAGLSLANQKDANYAIDQIDKAINKTSMVRATFGSIQNRLEHKITNLTTTQENLTEAESSIRDTDMASEMMNYTKFNILQQAAQSMLAQANQQPQSVLQLLG